MLKTKLLRRRHILIIIRSNETKEAALKKYTSLYEAAFEEKTSFMDLFSESKKESDIILVSEVKASKVKKLSKKEEKKIEDEKINNLINSDGYYDEIRPLDDDEEFFKKKKRKVDIKVVLLLAVMTIAGMYLIISNVFA